MIEQSCVEKILQAAKIEEVVGDFVSLRKRGANYIGLCPFHKEKTPSFSVSPAKNIFKCFGCGEGGTPIHFVMKHEQLDYPDALRYLANKYHIEVVETHVGEEDAKQRSEREGRFAANEFALKYFEHNLWETDEGRAIGLSYFHERGFSDVIIKKFHLGYSLESKDALFNEAVKAGHNSRYLFDNGLSFEVEDGRVLDRFRGRVMFPVFGISGKVVAFGGRVLKKTEHTGKYINSPESDIYHKSNELYGLYLAKQAITKSDCCYLVEGYTDVMSMHQSGIENVVASSGTSLTQGQISLIHRFTPNITVLYDGDSAGIKASIRGIDLLLEEGMNVKVVLLPDGEDPDSFAKSRDASAFEAYLREHSTDFIHFKTRLLLDEAGEDPVKRAALMSDIVTSISVIPDTMLRSVYIKDFSRMFDVDEAVTAAEVGKKRAKKLTQGKGLVYSRGRVQAEPEVKVEVPYMPANKVFAYKEERNLITFMVAKGEDLMEIVLPDGGSVEISVAEYIDRSLTEDGMGFEDPLHRKIYEELKAGVGMDAKTYFLNHPDIEVQKYVFSILDDNNAFPDGIETGRGLFYYVQRAVLIYKSRMLDYQAVELQKRIKAAGNADGIAALLEEQRQLVELRRRLSRLLGGRTISGL